MRLQVWQRMINVLGKEEKVKFLCVCIMDKRRKLVLRAQTSPISIIKEERKSVSLFFLLFYFTFLEVISSQGKGAAAVLNSLADVR